MAACGAEPNGGASPSTSSGGQTSASHTRTEVGAIQIEGGVLKIGTGSATLNMRVGQNMVVFERAFVETGVVGVEDSNESRTRISFAPMTSVKPGMSAGDFAALLTAQEKRQAVGVDGLTAVGQVEAVAADTTTVEGHPSRVHLLKVGDAAWNLTLAAPTKEKLDELAEMAKTLSVESKVPSLDREVSVGFGNDANAATAQKEARSTQSVISADGALRGRLEGGAFYLTGMGRTVSFPNPEGLSLVSESGSGDFIGVGRSGVRGYSVLFSQTSSNDFVSSAQLAEAVAAKAPGRVESSRALDVTSVAGHSAVAAEVKVSGGAAMRYYVVDLGSGYLAIVVRSPDVNTHPMDPLVSMIEDAQVVG